MKKTDEYFMREAIKEAQKAVKKGEWPVGCVIEVGGKIISRGHNLSHIARHKLEHAEMIALRKKDTYLRKHPQEATLYTTCEPCPMCIGACLVYKIKRIVCGANPEDSGGLSLLNHLPSYYDQPKFQIQTHVGVMETECYNLFVGFRPKKMKGF